MLPEVLMPKSKVLSSWGGVGRGGLFHLEYWPLLLYLSWCCPWPFFPCSLKLSHSLPEEGLPLPPVLPAYWYWQAAIQNPQQVSISERKRNIIMSCFFPLSPKEQHNWVKETASVHFHRTDAWKMVTFKLYSQMSLFLKYISFQRSSRQGSGTPITSPGQEKQKNISKC